MILVLDTETTGLPANYRAPVSDLENWPRAVQIAWATYENDGTFVGMNNYIIRPDGYEIPADSTAIHGITNERALADGFSINSVLVDLAEYIEHADYIVAHNIDFDASIIGAEFIRAGMDNAIEFAPMICTMRASTEFCAIPGKYDSYKWPNLNELHIKLFSESIMVRHDAKADVDFCAKCFFELVKRGVIVLDVAPTPVPEPELAVTTEEIEAVEAAEAADALTEEISLYNPVQLQSSAVRSYREQDQTRMTMFHADQSLWEAQRELDDVNYVLRQTDAYLACKNEQQRADYLYGHNQEQSHTVGIARLDALGAKLDFERAHDNVERVRMLLRIAELSAGITAVQK